MQYFEFNKYSSLLLIFFFHGFVYAILLLKKARQNERAAEAWLSAFLWLSIALTATWMLGFAGWYDGFSHGGWTRDFMFYVPTQHTLLLGPVVYFYVRSLLNQNYHFERRDYWHFVPGALYIIWCIIVFVVDNWVLHRYYLMNGDSDPDLDTWYRYAGLVSMAVYLGLSIRYYNQYQRVIYAELSFADSLTFKWVRNFLLGFFGYVVLTFSFEVIDIFMHLNYAGTWWYYFIFAFLYYYMAIEGYSNAVVTRVGFDEIAMNSNLPNFAETPVLTTLSPNETTKNTLENTDNSATDLALAPWKTKLLDVMETAALYRNPELTLTDLATRLHTNTVVLSRVINQGFGMNFNDFINRYRVEEVKTNLQNEKKAHLTIMSIAYDAGFNSKATFNRAFKKHTGKNPKDLLSQI
jgi:AraC-like DNA-binding protein